MKNIRVATGQFVIQSNLQVNKKSIIKLIQAATKKKARVLVLPECGLTGYTGCEVSTTKDLKAKEIDDALIEIGAVAKKSAPAVPRRPNLAPRCYCCAHELNDLYE